MVDLTKGKQLCRLAARFRKMCARKSGVDNNPVPIHIKPINQHRMKKTILSEIQNLSVLLNHNICNSGLSQSRCYRQVSGSERGILPCVLHFSLRGLQTIYMYCVLTVRYSIVHDVGVDRLCLH